MAQNKNQNQREDNSVQQILKALPNLSDRALKNVVKEASRRMSSGARSNSAVEGFVKVFPDLTDEKKMRTFTQIGVVPVHHGSKASGYRFPPQVPLIGRIIREVSTLGNSINYVNSQLTSGNIPHGNEELTKALMACDSRSSGENVVSQVVEILREAGNNLQKGIKSARPVRSGKKAAPKAGEKKSEAKKAAPKKAPAKKPATKKAKADEAAPKKTDEVKAA